ncbi:hypothetical protein M514_15349 [Trichuris suis]|uniref:Uncharacterized protein n=1 Tax=Trichuris suis TaxID=68888 RepID=A0A085NSR7_9BILA|nr:hypothetical protein M514_15349 [Trichuris suis]
MSLETYAFRVVSRIPFRLGHIAFFRPVALFIASSEVLFSGDRWFRWAFARFVHLMTYSIILCGTILPLVLIGSPTLFHTCRTIICNLGHAALPVGLTVIASLAEQSCTNGTHWIRRNVFGGLVETCAFGVVFRIPFRLWSHSIFWTRRSLYRY